MLVICFAFPRKLSLLLWRIYGTRAGSLFSGARWLVNTSNCPLLWGSAPIWFPLLRPTLCCFCNKYLIFHNFLWFTPNVVHVTLYLASKELWQFTCFQFKCFYCHYTLSLGSIPKKTRWIYFLFMVQFTFHVLSKVGKNTCQVLCQN